MPTSYTRSVKTGKGQRIVYNTSLTGKTTRTAVRRTNLGGGQYLTTRFTENKPLAYKPSPKSRSTSRNTRSSGDGGAALGMLVIVGIFTGLWFVIKAVYSWATKHKDVPVAPSIENNGVQ